MKPLLLTASFMLMTRMGFCQKQFSLAELLEMNRLSESRITAYLGKLGFTHESTNKTAASRFLMFSNRKGERIVKNGTAGSFSGLVWDSPVAIDIPGIKRELEKMGFRKMSSTANNHLLMENYGFGNKLVVLAYPDNTELGKLLSVYMVTIQEETKRM